MVFCRNLTGDSYTNTIQQNISFPDVVERVNRFNNLYGDGPFSLAAGELPQIRDWQYTPNMLRKFLYHVEEELRRENPGLFKLNLGGIFNT